MYRYLYEIRIDNPDSALHGCLYYGKHETFELNDNYYGSGRLILNYKKKYGTVGLIKTILNFYETTEELLQAEFELVKQKKTEYKDKCLNLMPGGYGTNNWKEYISEEQYKNRCKNMSIGQHTKMTTEQRKAKSAWANECQYKNLTAEELSKRGKIRAERKNEKWKNNQSLREEYVERCIARHANMSPAEKQTIYSKVSTTLKKTWNDEQHREIIENKKRTGEYRDIAKEASDNWRKEFVDMFGCQLEAFRSVGKAKEAMTLFREKPSTAEIKNFIEASFEQVCIDGVNYPSIYHAKTKLNLSLKKIKTLQKRGRKI